MSKVKAPKSKGIPNKHLHARSTFLYQAATYLTLQTATQDEFAIDVAQDKESHPHDAPTTQRYSPLALELASDLQQVSRKGQLRLAVDLKRSMCKSCNTVLIPGRTVNQTIENPSKGGNKPWADILVVTCLICGGEKRFPVGATKQPKKAKRRTTHTTSLSKTASEDDRISETTFVTGTD
ncbi:ribonuclease P protein subunit RPR2 [Alternaria panax]|uniref:Ribonuclease P protein subunit RPR2 n=1 Tax=Alternaria panax TaxID=48097 RepID=A0AAD4F8N0_9PLEO|nr:ribonuclease P protein subunit RPR2 [Alternaria panax]